MPRWALPARKTFAAQQLKLPGSQSRASNADALRAAALVMDSSRRNLTPTSAGWQNEVWGFYEKLGEFRYVNDWKSNMVSRVRLRAAIKEPDADEPTIQDGGIGVDVLDRLNGTSGTHTQLMFDMATHINTPGECWLLGEDDAWRVCSSEELRAKDRSYEVIDESSSPQTVRWRPVTNNAMVVRIWRPNKRLRYLADSPARAAMATMRELELVSRHMQAQYLSRLASAGLLLIPDEVALPARPEFQDEPDPFVREWIETAAEAIKTPGTAASVVPIPMRIPSEYIEKVKHIDFTLMLDRDIVAKRDSIIRRLANQLDAPPEILLGSGDTNHWSAWQIEESAVKAFILPTVETICEALTIGYLRPRIQASGDDPANWVMWYDASEITIRPDRSKAAVDAYDRLELNGSALRREIGFDEDDAPTDEELKMMLLKAMARQPANALTAFDQLTGESVTPPVTSERSDDGQASMPSQEDEDRSAPNTMDDAADTGDNAQLTRRQRLVQQSRATHFVELREWESPELRHSPICVDHQFSCPFTAAFNTHMNDPESPHPARSGTYVVTLDALGKLRFGEKLVNVPISAYISG